MYYRIFRKLCCIQLTLFVLIYSIGSILPKNVKAASVKEDFIVSEGVHYKDTRLNNSRINNAVRVLDINLKNNYTTMDVSLPVVLNKLERTTSQSLRYHKPGNLVVGAVNGGFFFNGAPMNLISKDNRLIHAGEVPVGRDKYANEPIVFGIDKNGLGLIDHYNLDLKYIHNGKTYPITSTNKERLQDNTILYTTYFQSAYTETNEWGTEIVVTLPESPTLEFGSTVTGKIEKIRPEGSTTKTAIPKNGFVLSAHGKGKDPIKGMKVGDPITLSVDIDGKWKQSSFMLMSGPMLVRDGKVHITMDSAHSKALERTARTAMATNKSRDKVFLVTVDGRQPGYSNGMTLPEFANYLVSIGADRALNLDGGGSTTMAVRKPGAFDPTLVNSPSDGSERSVSTILMAISNAPKGAIKELKVKRSKEGLLKVGEKITVTPTSAVDTYGNPVKPSDVTLQLVDSNQLGQVQGNTFIAKKEGKGTLRVSSGQATIKLPLEIEDPTKNIFTDVKSGYWARDQIIEAVQKGIVKGYDDKTFRPEKSVTRAEFVTLLTRALQIDGAGSMPQFKDGGKVASWAQEAVAKAYNAGIIKGYDDGTFRPDAEIKRQEIAVMVHRALGLKRTSNGPIGFSDESKIPDWSWQSVAVLKDHGLLQGKENNNFAPRDNTKRSEATVLLLRAQ